MDVLSEHFNYSLKGSQTDENSLLSTFVLVSLQEKKQILNPPSKLFSHSYNNALRNHELH